MDIRCLFWHDRYGLKLEDPFDRAEVRATAEIDFGISSAPPCMRRSCMWRSTLGAIVCRTCKWYGEATLQQNLRAESHCLI